MTGNISTDRLGTTLFSRLTLPAWAAVRGVFLVLVVLASLPSMGSVGRRAKDTLEVPAFTAYCEPAPEGARISERNGVTGWSDAKQKIVWYGYLQNTGSLTCAVRMRLSGAGKRRLRLSVGGESRLIELSEEQSGLVEAVFGEYHVGKPGYCRFSLEGVERAGADFGSPQALLLSGPAAVGAHFNLEERRNASSVHLGYPIEPGMTVTAFYNEVTVRTDPIWSYYMACGFHRGYFGIQVNSPTERRIIFSVWDSGNEGVDRKLVQPEDRVQLLKKGTGVVASDFGNEGTGGHSHLIFPWKKNTTYRFLVTARPDGTHTDYSAYFSEPQSSRWELIASFRAPKDGQALRGLYSFNENFVGANGQLRRLCEFGNQWVRTADGQWHELTTARFTHDPTGRESRKDYDAGTAGRRFYLSNGGFIAGKVAFGKVIHRTGGGRLPDRIPAEILP